MTGLTRLYPLLPRRALLSAARGRAADPDPSFSVFHVVRLGADVSSVVGGTAVEAVVVVILVIVNVVVSFGECIFVVFDAGGVVNVVVDAVVVDAVVVDAVVMVLV